MKSVGMFWRITWQRNQSLPSIFYWWNWEFNLCYSETIPDNQHSHVYKGRKELLEDCCDFFILLREKDTNDNNSMRTMICHSGRVRNDMGKLRLLLPYKNVLLMKSLVCVKFFLVELFHKFLPNFCILTPPFIGYIEH